MVSINRLTRGFLAAAVVVAMAGCGTSVGPDLGSSAYGASGSGLSAGFGASDAQVGADTNIMELNTSGNLNSLSDSDLESLDNSTDDSAPPVSSNDPTVQDLAPAQGVTPSNVSQASAGGQSMTKVGIVRSNSAGQFFLQTSKGFLWWKTEVSLPLSAPDSTTGLKISSDLNCKVILRGSQFGNACLVRLIFKVPDFSVIWGLFTKGHIAGKAYDASTMAGIPDAQVTITSVANGEIFRALTSRDGSYEVGELSPGEYQVSVSAADYSAGSQAITVSKMHTSTVNLGLTSSMAQPAAGGSAPAGQQTVVTGTNGMFLN